MGAHTAAERARPAFVPLLEARPRLGRRRLRRHRHQPALRPARGPAAPPAATASTQDEVIGIVSLLIWTLILIVTLKYVVLILRADNRGEGGTLSLLALAQRAIGRRTRLLFLLGVAGAALFYGDAAITPAISVLSAVEGLETRRPALRRLRPADHRRHPRRCSSGSRAAARHGSRPSSARSPSSGSSSWRPSASTTPATSRRSSHALNPAHCIGFLVHHGSARCRSWARSSSRSPAPRRSTPTWATSAAVRSAPPGSASSSRRWRSTTSARAASSSPSPTRSPTRSS